MCSQVSRSALGKNSIKKEGGIHLARNNIRLKVKNKRSWRFRLPVAPSQEY